MNINTILQFATKSVLLVGTALVLAGTGAEYTAERAGLTLQAAPVLHSADTVSTPNILVLGMLFVLLGFCLHAFYVVRTRKMHR
jgi:hypothetical protein